jgi:high affinity Mn2+ porin
MQNITMTALIYNNSQSKNLIVLAMLILFVLKVNGQNSDSTKDDRFTIHVQTTVITQYKPAFKANYSGPNSLISQAETQRSTTSTLYLGARLWKSASIYLNPEVAGGSGLSGSLGVGSSSNGETYRIDNASPQFELARLYITQIIPLTNKTEYQKSDLNTLGGKIPTNYLALTVGKICVSDFFDLNKYSHDPRTQFMSWALMNNGSWDFPANTRGYTPSIVLEYVTPKNEWRAGFSLEAKVANAMAMNWNVGRTGAYILEYTHNYKLNNKKGAVRLVSYYNLANMGNYNQSIKLNPNVPNILSSEAYGHSKYGFGINGEQEINNNMGIFFRAGWDDGNNETWAYTEIDRTASFGISSNGNKWKRPNDNVGLAYVVSGLSTPHRNYLRAGGRGFELGDGNLNYSLEQLTELYYSMELIKNLYLSGTYQFILNPGYNKDRGPVNVFSIRVHLAF